MIVMKNQTEANTLRVSRKPRDISEISLSETSSYRLSRQNQLIRKGRDAEAERLGVTVDEWRLLFVLRQVGPHPSIRLAERSLMDRGTVSKAVRRMEERGLVFRVSDASDARIAIVNLTDSGHALATQISNFMMEREMGLIAQLTDEEWDTWLRVTEKFHDFLVNAYGDDG